MLDLHKVLSLIPPAKPTTFGELCRDLETDCPDKGDRSGWRMLFNVIEDLERNELIEVSRICGRIDTLLLTSEGIERVRDIRKGRI